MQMGRKLNHKLWVVILKGIILQRSISLGHDNYVQGLGAQFHHHLEYNTFLYQHIMYYLEL